MSKAKLLWKGCKWTGIALDFMMFLPDIKFFSTLAVTKDFHCCTLYSTQASCQDMNFRLDKSPRCYKSTWKTHEIQR